MLRVPLFRKGKVVGHALLDDEDAEHAGFLWHLDSGGYAARQVAGRWERLHRVLLGLEPGDGRESDHLDGDKLNNRRANLAVVTRGQNCENVHTRRDLPRGVYLAASGRFYAQVKKGGVKYCLGHHDTPEEAAEAAAAKRRELGFHGDVGLS